MKAIELDEGQLDQLIERITEAKDKGLALSPEDYELLLDVLLNFVNLQTRMGDNDITLRKLKKLAGLIPASEKRKPSQTRTEKKQPKKKPKRNPKPKPQQTIIHEITDLNKGQTCPECNEGKLYKYQPAKLIRITGQSPFVSTAHIREQLRCNLCDAVFSADLPASVTQDGGPTQQYGFSARSLMAINKYFAGSPFNRQQSLQELFGFPIAASTIFDQCEALANALQPVFVYLKSLAAQASHYHLDDTTHRILDQKPIMKKKRGTDTLQLRTGIYTSGLIATAEDRDTVLFQTNIGHAGEWIDEILSKRAPDRPPPILMSDALSSNQPTDTAVHTSLCNSHARRKFDEVEHQFPEPVGRLLTLYGLIWQHDAWCKKQALTSAERLAYHKQHSWPVMTCLRDWCENQLKTDAIEANCSLGKAIKYFLNHFHGLTLFCQMEGVKIDNNFMEATLKLIVRGRKNSLFYKTLAGAAVSDVITSLLATCVCNRVNAFDYFNAVQRNQDLASRNPNQWLPWNFEIPVNNT